MCGHILSELRHLPLQATALRRSCRGLCLYTRSCLEQNLVEYALQPLLVSARGESGRSEFIGIVNYGIIGLIQLELGYCDRDDLNTDRALELYDKYAKAALDLMIAKNHDYDEAWRSMRITSYTDLILMKIYRTKQIESLSGQTLVSEGIDANYMDMINYSVFALIKLDYGE